MNNYFISFANGRISVESHNKDLLQGPGLAQAVQNAILRKFAVKLVVTDAMVAMLVACVPADDITFDDQKVTIDALAEAFMGIIDSGVMGRKDGMISDHKCDEAYRVIASAAEYCDMELSEVAKEYAVVFTDDIDSVVGDNFMHHFKERIPEFKDHLSGVVLPIQTLPIPGDHVKDVHRAVNQKTQPGMFSLCIVASLHDGVGRETEVSVIQMPLTQPE